MTDEQIDTMEAGQEMNRMVRRATGWPLASSGSEFIEPSTNLNQAMLAGQDCGLFDRCDVALTPLGCVVLYRATGERFAISQEPPVAICRAILKLLHREQAAMGQNVDAPRGNRAVQHKAAPPSKPKSPDIVVLREGQDPRRRDGDDSPGILGSLAGVVFGTH